MPLFIWKPSYELAIPEIDLDHRRLVGIINELYEAMKDGRGHLLLNQIIDRLLDYIQQHFEAEESFMRASLYPELEAHRQEHLRLREELLEMDRLRRAGDKPTAGELLTFLCAWMRTHISETDKAFGGYLKRDSL